METRRIKIEDLPELLLLKSRLNQEELSKEIGITPATLNNWRKGNVAKIGNEVKGKLARALDKNKWGFHISKFAGDNVEIIYENSPIEPIEEISYLHNKIDTLQDLVNKLVKDNFVMKEKLEQYEVKK